MTNETAQTSPSLWADLILQAQLDQPKQPDLEAIRQEHEDFLEKLQSEAVSAIAYDDWSDFYKLLIDFQSEHDLFGVCGVAGVEEEDADSNHSNL